MGRTFECFGRGQGSPNFFVGKENTTKYKILTLLRYHSLSHLKKIHVFLLSLTNHMCVDCLPSFFPF